MDACAVLDGNYVYLIGGYAQLSYGFNYYGPTGPQRDEMCVVRKLRGEVEY